MSQTVHYIDSIHSVPTFLSDDMALREYYYENWSLSDHESMMHLAYYRESFAFEHWDNSDAEADQAIFPGWYLHLMEYDIEQFMREYMTDCDGGMSIFPHRILGDIDIDFTLADFFEQGAVHAGTETATSES
ncbi:hypothetical protein CVT24_005208 [Panaeolus cyanescens]|uniref:Uncharacterized protein n=1 Tax=Panaeolus cyanescens TaxID=181874 RepID=A0A409Y994_9AGAR|nr:hypothetical protein CVT24_005208 [Panaeolus cyanescens]